MDLYGHVFDEGSSLGVIHWAFFIEYFSLSFLR